MLSCPICRHFVSAGRCFDFFHWLIPLGLIGAFALIFMIAGFDWRPRRQSRSAPHKCDAA
jgi:hypothetical protein